jgi:hypothetical protein
MKSAADPGGLAEKEFGRDSLCAMRRIPQIKTRGIYGGS